MGASMTSIHESIPDDENRSKEEILDYLDLLQELATTKAQLFHQNVVSCQNKNKCSMKAVKCLSTKMFGSVKRNTDIKQEVVDAVGSFVSMEWINGGLRALFKRSFQNILSKGGERENKSSFTYNSNGEYQRVDYYIYKRDVKYGPVCKFVDNILVVAFSISSIDSSPVINSIEVKESKRIEPESAKDEKEGPNLKANTIKGAELDIFVNDSEPIKQEPEIHASEESLEEEPKSLEEEKKGPGPEENDQGPEEQQNGHLETEANEENQVQCRTKVSPIEENTQEVSPSQQNQNTQQVQQSHQRNKKNSKGYQQQRKNSKQSKTSSRGYKGRPNTSIQGASKGTQRIPLKSPRNSTSSN